MYRNMAQLYRNNQIIDVTKECTFDWYQEPKSCYAYLQVSSASGDFTDGETVTGQNSGATATVFSSYVNGGRVYVTNVNGTFQADETITGGSSNQTATVDGFVAERSYPNNIIRGTFPDSIKSRDLDDSLDLEISSNGAKYVLLLRINLPKSMFFTVVPIVTRVRIFKDYVRSSLALIEQQGSDNTTVGIFTHQWATAQYNDNIKTGTAGAGFHYGDRCLVGMYHSDKFVCKYSIKTIRVLKLVI